MGRWRQIKDSVTRNKCYNKVKPKAYKSTRRKDHVGFNLDKGGKCTNLSGERSGNVYITGVLWEKGDEKRTFPSSRSVS